MTEKPMTVAEVANFLRRSIKSVKRLPIPFSRVGKGRLYCCVLLAMPVGNRLPSCRRYIEILAPGRRSRLRALAPRQAFD